MTEPETQSVTGKTVTGNTVTENTVTENSPELLANVFQAIETSEDLGFLRERQDIEIAHLLESVDVPRRLSVITSLPAKQYWQVLNLLQYETAKNIHTSLSEALATERLAQIAEGDIITFADFLPADFVEEFLLSQSAETVAHIQQALSYEDHKAGRYAEPAFLVANAKNSVGRIRNEILKRAEIPVRLVIVRDAAGIVGTVAPEKLLNHENNVKLGSLAVSTPVLNDTQDIYEISNQIPLDGNAHFFPVLCGEKVMGIMSLTTIAVTLRELSLKTIVPENVKSEEDLFTPLKVATRLRGVWLVINLMTAFAASAIIGLFDNVVQQVVALAVLMPVVASMGGIAGSQTLAVSLRGIALNHLHQSNLKLLVHKELKIAAINGFVMGGAIAAIVWYVFDSLALGLIICCAIGVNSLAAALSGTLIPFTLKKFNIDPAVAGAVVLTTVTDVVGFLVFLGLGALFLI
ncbi:Magnesium transporter MgtE [Vibrio aerogenes CECT 7868]|uniref:Magnesium transporter MgtE n=1 Tax=Vibrio aerogenes CECT 7868 TaxID=1216006 RepID=A0A1M5Y3I0_9VIBR|nr:magnesium transporter [Vibrio aerogenes]SHI06063.1 Magnesium transporter MgtE [Vibrio aerogenes CECT 7868]